MYLNKYDQLVYKWEKDYEDALSLMEEMSRVIGVELDNYENVRPHLAVLLFDADSEYDQLEGTVFRRFENLAIVPVVFRHVSYDRNSCVKICCLWPDIWGVDPDLLVDDAISNAPNVLPPSFGSIRTAISEIVPGLCASEPKEEPQMYYLTNVNRIYGASAMLYPHILELISEELKADLFILPSSRHETVILPDKGESPLFLYSVVSSINSEYILPGDVLCTSVYYYDRADKALRRIC